MKNQIIFINLNKLGYFKIAGSNFHKLRHRFYLLNVFLVKFFDSGFCFIIVQKLQLLLGKAVILLNSSSKITDYYMFVTLLYIKKMLKSSKMWSDYGGD